MTKRRRSTTRSSPRELKARRLWVLLLPLLLAAAGCGPTLRTKETFTPKKVQELLFDDTCKLQPFFDGGAVPPRTEAEVIEAADGATVLAGRITFVLEPGMKSRDALLRLLQESFDRLPEISPTESFRLGVHYAEGKKNDKELRRHIPIGSSAVLEVKGRELELPYHPCVSAFFFGADHYVARRRALGLPEPVVHKTLADYIGELGGKDQALAEAAGSELVAMGGRAVPQLSGALRDPSPEVQTRVLGVLRKMLPTAGAAAPAVLELMERSPRVRGLAALTLLELVPVLRAGTNDADPVRRVRDATELARVEMRRPAEVLLSCALKESAEARRQSWTALGKIRETSVPELLRVVADARLPSPERALASEALVELACLGAVEAPTVEKALSESSSAAEDELQQALETSLARLRTPSEPAAGAPAASR